MRQVVLAVLGGLNTESTPEQLPPGASPQVINCDFNVGTVLPRPGKKNEFTYGASTITQNAGFAQSIAGPHAPNEAPWISPSNITHNTPGTYANVSLNVPAGSPGGGGTFDHAVPATGNSSTVAVSGAPTAGNETALLLSVCPFGDTLSGPVPSTGWNLLDNPDGADSSLYSKFLPDTTTQSVTQSFTGGSGPWATLLMFFGSSTGLAPSVIQSTTIRSGSISSGTNSNTFGSNITAGNGVLVVVVVHSISVDPFGPVSITDSHGNTYSLVGNIIGLAPAGALLAFWMPNLPAGSLTVTYSSSMTGGGGGTVKAYEIGGIGTITATPGFSQVLEGLNYPFSIPSSQQILGVEVQVFGHQSTQTDPAAVVIAQFEDPSDNLSPQSFSGQLPLIDGALVLGNSLSSWGLTLAPSLFNNPNLTVQITAVSPNNTLVSFSIYAVQITLFLSPVSPPSIDYLKTFAQQDGDVLNMALGSDGIFYQEDVINNPGVLTSVLTGVPPNSFAQSATQDDREFIAVSDLLKGTDIPRSYSPPIAGFNRLSQVGPGAAPSVGSSSAASTIQSITQFAPVQIRRIVWGASPNAINDSTPGNILVIFGEGRTPGNIFQTLPNVAVGDQVILTGLPSTFPLKGGGSLPYDLKNGGLPYTVLQVTTAIVGGNEVCPVFTVQAPAVAYGYSQDFGSGGTPTSGWFWQLTKATMTTTAQVPNLEVGNQFQITGTGGSPPSGYDGTWIVSATPNADTMQITSTVLSGNVATYGFILSSGTAPAVGQNVTVTGTLNGNGIFNVSSASIVAATPGSFSVAITSPDIPTAAESGSGVIFGTIFIFDPGQLVGNKTGGSIITAGVIAAGIRKVCYSFLTIDGYLTQPSPIATQSITAGASSLIISNLLTGPSNVIARVIHLTAANGGNFYNIPIPVTVVSNGVNVINTSTWLRDNVSTSITLSFSDGVLLGADAIDIQGNNLFETAELGSCRAVVPYANRMWAFGEQEKITNFLNWSFDGGFIGAITGTSNVAVPAGWILDSVNGNGVNVVSSPIFGFAYQVSNSSGSTQAIYGMIYQGAFQDEFGVPILSASTTYSVRVTASVPTGPTTGNLVVDLFDPKTSLSLGTFTLPLSSLGQTMTINIGTLLTVGLSPVPSGLRLRLYVIGIQNGVTVQVDRIEVFPTEAPNLNTQITGSYASNFEAFDQVTGVIGTSVTNQQAAVIGFNLFDVFYIVKTSSMISIRNVDGLEPAFWPIPRVVSETTGTRSIYGVSVAVNEENEDEQSAVIAGRAGAFLFFGGQPVKISEEIQSLWEQINWTYEHTIWTKNDIINRRIYIGVPLKTPNTWFPSDLGLNNANPTTPNVVLMCNYKQLNTPEALASGVGVHVSYSGKMIASEYRRKWSIWTIKAPCAAFLKRADNTSPIFFGNSDNNGKIYDLVTGQYSDDGTTVIDQRYFPYGFISEEQEQGLQLGSVRKTYLMMLLILDGAGPVQFTVFPNNMNTTNPYSHDLLPNINLPSSVNGDIEIPVNETANRLFIRFRCATLGAGFILSRVTMGMVKDPFSGVRGRNN